MCLVRHDRAESEAGGCPRARYDPSDASAPSDIGGLFNHADSDKRECNCICQSCIVTSADGMRLALIVSTTRDVSAGEELRWDYRWDALGDDDGSGDLVEVGLPFAVARDTTQWTAPPNNPPQPDLDAYQVGGRDMARDWALQRHGHGDRATLFRPDWCGPHVHLSSLPNGLAAAVVVKQSSGKDYQEQLPKLVMA